MVQTIKAQNMQILSAEDRERIVSFNELRIKEIYL